MDKNKLKETFISVGVVVVVDFFTGWKMLLKKNQVLLSDQKWTNLTLKAIKKKRDSTHF